MSPLKPKGSDESSESLRELLIDFWIGTIEDVEAQYPEKMKASEYLAKYILDAGPSAINRKKKELMRPPTSEVLRLTEYLENAHEQWKPTTEGDR